ncbi:MAG: T9SS type A sorting domain-containing protein, partial [Bacteroidetes bacterium]|nr:T9SS type A sorting domain-containing protein [Bacteroidota bacterium]
MKKILLTLGLLGTMNLAFSQDYWAIKSAGTAAPYNKSDATGTLIIGGDAGAPIFATLSDPIDFPFSTWNFYGNPVTQFKVSSSGYLTFDISQTGDVVANTTLPNAAAPKNAIFAFWDNLSLEALVQSGNTYPSDIKYFTYGTAPSRVFVVQWRLAGVKGTTPGANATYFAIRFYEAGNFDIVHNYGFGTFNATVGVQDPTRNKGFMVSGSPSLNFGGPNGAPDDTKSVVYTFNYGVQPNVTPFLKNMTSPIASLNVPESQKIILSVSNTGKLPISTCKFNYTVDGGSVITASLTGLNVPANGGGSSTLTHTTPLSLSAADLGKYKTIKAWLSEINTNDGKSDTATFQVFVNKGVAGTKRIFLEEGSGAWCGWCPGGHVIMRDILEANLNVGGTYNKVVGVVHHNSDGMANTQSNTINTAYSTGYPYGVVERFLFPDVATVGINRGLWESKVASRMNVVTPVNVTITDKTYDAATRKVTFTVKADFVDYAKPGDIRITAMISEDKVRGPMLSATSTTWTQHSYYAEAAGGGEGPSHELYTEPEYLYGYFHNHVAKTVLPSAWGNAGVVPNNPIDGSSYSQTFTYTVPATTKVSENDYSGNLGIYTKYQSTFPGDANNKPNDMNIIGIISYYNADVKAREVLNVNETPLMFGTGIKEESKSAYISKVFPNPTSGLTQIDFKLSSSDNVTIELYNVMGQKVQTINNGAFAGGDHSVYFNAENTNNGVYFIKVSSTDYTSTHKILI